MPLVTFTAGGEERPSGEIRPSISEKKSALDQNFKDPSPGDTKVHIKFHRVLPTPPRPRRSERLGKWEGEVETLSVPRGRDLATLEKSTEVVGEGNDFLGRDGNADLPTAEGLLPDELQDVIDAVLLRRDGRWEIPAWKASCQASRLVF